MLIMNRLSCFIQKRPRGVGGGEKPLKNGGYMDSGIVPFRQCAWGLERNGDGGIAADGWSFLRHVTPGRVGSTEVKDPRERGILPGARCAASAPSVWLSLAGLDSSRARLCLTRQGKKWWLFKFL